MAIPNWLSLSQISGNSGTTVIRVTASTNSDLTTRMKELNVYCDNIGLSGKTTVVQNPNNRGLQVNPNEITAPITGGTYTIRIITNESWRVVSFPSFVTLNTQSGTGMSVITVTFGTNTFNYDLLGDIVIETDYASATVQLTQKTRDYSSEYLAFEITSGSGNILWKISGSGAYRDIEYSKNNGTTWTTVRSTYSGAQIPASTGDIILFRGNNNDYSPVVADPNNNNSSVAYSYVLWCSFRSTGDIRLNISGNIMSLINSTDFTNLKTISSDRCFYNLFNSFDALVSAENLVLPATTLATNCYEGMFAGSTNLVNPPLVLPATELKVNCYNYMFGDCTSLTTAPYINAKKLANGCCYDMFFRCTSLVNVQSSLPIIEYDDSFTTSTSGCFERMFKNCTSLTTAPSLPATTLRSKCYYEMFSDCTSLVNPPELPATTLVGDCYAYMFYGCSSLTTAPSLPATTLAGSCYERMFTDCTSLVTAPVLPATTLSYKCYTAMFARCTSLTTAPELPAITLVRTDGEVDAEYCYQSMFANCTSLTTAPDLPATTLSNNCYQNMFNGCTGITTAPELSATALTSYCYYQMFKGCSSLNYIKCLARNLFASSPLLDWVDGVASSGTFVKASGVSWSTGTSGIPNRWTVQEV